MGFFPGSGPGKKETGRILREKYEIGLIRNEYDFKEVLSNVLSGGERS